MFDKTVSGVTSQAETYVFPNPREKKLYKEQTNFNFTWRLLNEQGID